MWCEELGRLLLLRHQKNRAPDSKSPGMHPQIQKAMPPLPQGDPNGPWAPNNQGQPGQSLSVVTTVWGMTNSTQSGPFTHNTPGFTNTTMSSTTNYTQQAQGFPGNQIQKPPYGPQGMPYRQNSGSYQRPSGYPPTPNTPGSNTPISSPSEYPPAQGNPALSAALVAAAATATATATATASMVALHQEPNAQQMNVQMNMQNGAYPPQMQMHGQPPYGNQYPNMGQRPPGSMNMGQGPGPGPMMTKPGMVYQRRPTPYPTASQLIAQKRQAQGFNGAQYAPYGNPQQYQPKPQYPPTQQPLPSPTFGPQQGMRPYLNGQNPYSPNQFPQGRQGGQGWNNPAAQQNMQSSNMNYPHSPLPGNPTPPMTPGPPYPGQMPIKKDPDELRLTFPVRDGVVLPPFRLEHNLAVSNHVFHLRESVYQTLMWRSDLELQLKCFHHEDRQMNTNWPASVTVSVNANPLNIERGENKTSHKPLYLKDVCQPGRNTIQITVTACCCSHLFVLQLVHRPSVRSVLQGLLRKRLLPAEHCITKIKRNFTSVAANPLNGEDGVEQTAIKVPLKCPITFRRITLPARGHECKHIQCFDLESYLQLNCERGSWRCPVCNKTALLEGLEIDQYIWGILTNLSNTDFDEVTIDQTAAWKPVPHKNIKEEESADPCANARWMKAMSPSSMQLPTMNSWDIGRQPSPFSMPPSQGPPYSGIHNPEGMPPGPPPQGSYQHQGGPPPGEYSRPLSHMPGPGSEALNSVDNLSTLNTSGDTAHSPGQYPPVSDHLRHPDQANMNSNMTSPPNHSQNLNINHSNGSHPLSHQPPSSGNQQNNSVGDNCHIGDGLNFDPSIIDGDGQTNNLDLQLENLGDPIELLSYLGPPENSNNDSSSGQNGGGTGNNQGSSNPGDDLLALFD